MSDTPNAAKGLRDRLGGNTEDRLGKALSELLESPLLTGAIGRAFDAREKASQAQEVAMGALNLPSAADIERLTRRLRSVSHRLEGIEDGVDRLDRALAPSGVEARLTAIEGQLSSLAAKLEQALSAQTAAAAAPAPTPAPRAAGSRSAAAGAKTSRRSGTSRSNAKQTRAKQVRAAKEAKAAKAGGTGKAAKASRGTSARARGGRAGKA
ncbi:MAG TPA: hypothetical protein VN618_00925 [Solirubrobacteraceae bacterium]|nr:hypothetical protein [Solirubrobacteraceae bacterium]